MRERSLEGASTVSLFLKNCEELNEWILEKMDQFDNIDILTDLKTVQALQRRHENLERELQPIEERVERCRLLANDVLTAYPSERRNVEKERDKFEKHFLDLKKKAIEKKNRLETAVGREIFNKSAAELMRFLDYVESQLKTEITSKDVNSAENDLKSHSDLGDEINAKEDEFEEVRELGKSLIANHGQNVDLKQLDRKDGILLLYNEKGDLLQQRLDLMMFLREADHIDSQSNLHLQFLANKNVGNDLDEVEQLIRRHTDFENTLMAQDERLQGFCEMGDKLIKAGHYDKVNIKAKTGGAVEKRDKIKAAANDRKTELLKSLKFNEFKTDVGDLSDWIRDKKAVVLDLNTLQVEKKLKKHEAFAGELRANETRLKGCNKAGEKLKKSSPEYEKRVEDLLSKVNKEWEELAGLSIVKMDELRKAEAELNHSKIVNDIDRKMDEIEAGLGAEMGKDRRSCKEMLKRVVGVEQEVEALEKKIAALGDKAG